MQKRKSKNQIQLIVIGSFLIVLSFCFIGYKIFQVNSTNEYEESLKQNFFEEYQAKRNSPNIEVEQQDTPTHEPQKNIVNSPQYIAVLKIPKINLEKGLVDKNSIDNNINKNIQILKEANMPDKENGNLILAAHSGNSVIGYFRELDKLQISDEVIVFYEGYEYKYKIVNIYDVEKTGTAHIIRNASKNTLTLITCRDGTDKQIIIICELIQKG